MRFVEELSKGPITPWVRFPPGVFAHAVQKMNTYQYIITHTRMKNIEILGVVFFKRLFFGNQRGEKKSISVNNRFFSLLVDFQKIIF